MKGFIDLIYAARFLLPKNKNREQNYAWAFNMDRCHSAC
jgi:hypothetical protein